MVNRVLGEDRLLRFFVSLIGTISNWVLIGILKPLFLRFSVGAKVVRHSCVLATLNWRLLWPHAIVAAGSKRICRVHILLNISECFFFSGDGGMLNWNLFSWGPCEKWLWWNDILAIILLLQMIKIWIVKCPYNASLRYDIVICHPISMCLLVRRCCLSAWEKTWSGGRGRRQQKRAFASSKPPATLLYINNNNNILHDSSPKTRCASRPP